MSALFRDLLLLLAALAAFVVAYFYWGLIVPWLSVADGYDQQLFLLLNFEGGDLTDGLMTYASSKLAWIPVGMAFVAFLFYRGYSWQAVLLVVVAIAVAVAISDQLTSSVIKPWACRPRPSHNESLNTTIHLINGYHGGRYGFCSSHAANAMAVWIFVTMLLRSKLASTMLLAWAVLVCYSRIYIGVHYPADVACGAMVGLLVGWLTFHAYRKVRRLCKARGWI